MACRFILGISPVRLWNPPPGEDSLHPPASGFLPYFAVLGTLRELCLPPPPPFSKGGRKVFVQGFFQKQLLGQTEKGFVLGRSPSCCVPSVRKGQWLFSRAEKRGAVRFRQPAGLDTRAPFYTGCAWNGSGKRPCGSAPAPPPVSRGDCRMCGRDTAETRWILKKAGISAAVPKRRLSDRLDRRLCPLHS